MTIAPVARPPFDPEPAAVLPAVDEVLPSSVPETFRDEDIAYATGF